MLNETEEEINLWLLIMYSVWNKETFMYYLIYSNESNEFGSFSFNIRLLKKRYI